MALKPKNRNYILVPVLVGLVLSHFETSFAAPACEVRYDQWANKTSQQVQTSAKILLKGDGFSDAKVNKVNAAWEISRIGLAELSQDLHSMDNLLYYIGTGILAKENVLADGPGGGGKTFGMRKVYEAQLRAVHGQTTAAQKRYQADLMRLIEEVKSIVNEEKEILDPEKRIFTIQFHALLSESTILGGPNPFKFLENGEYEIDYSRALIAKKNMFAILDEVEKAPPALQMTLLSILNERQALAGNQVVNTLLESVAATTNATLGELIAQALPHEIGGRKALIDRFPIKFHVVNTTRNPLDAFLFMEKISASRSEKKYTVIDLRSLRPLLSKIEISKELIDAAVEISVQMDRTYTQKLKAAQEQVAGSQQAPSFYPPFSGSTRVQSKVIKLWKSAFLMRQLMQGIPFESLTLRMGPKDLVDLAPSLLQGGPDFIAPGLGKKITFLQYQDIGLVEVKSNLTGRVTKAGKDFLADNSISIGHYDPATQTFSYESLSHRQLRRVYFDVNAKKLTIRDEIIAKELGEALKDQTPIFTGNEKIARRFENLNERLYKLHVALTQRPGKNDLSPTFQIDGIINSLLTEAPLREEGKAQLSEIQEFHNQFLSVLNSQIQQLQNTKHTRVDAATYRQQDQAFIQKAQALTNEMREALKSQDTLRILSASAKSVQESLVELNAKFKNSGSSLVSILKTMAAKKNLMLFGPPGSAKTMMTRMIFEKELEWIKEAQLAGANQILASVLPLAKDQKGILWIKQFHPMSTEGDIVGRLDLKEVRNGKGYAYNRSGSLAAKDVFFALLDEFEKAPPGVKTALLSLLNERELFAGDEPVKSNIIAIVLSTNSTPGEFMTSQGEFSTAFPIFDRIQKKAYAFNKLETSLLKDFYTMVHLEIMPELHSPLFISPLNQLSSKVQIKGDVKMLMAEIHMDFMREAVKRSTQERAYHKADPQAFPDYYMNSRGESNRSLSSMIFEELPMDIMLKRIIKGEKVETLSRGIEFDLKDLETFAELYLTANFAYEVKTDYGSDGLLIFKVESKDISGISDRIDDRERKTLETMKWEAEKIVNVLNIRVQTFLKSQMEMIKEHPNLFPSAFASREDRISWLKKSGFSDEDIKAFYP